MWVGGSATKQQQTNIWTAIYHTSITTVYITIRESESVNRRMTDNTTALRKRGKGQKDKQRSTKHHTEN